jgi:hypothetical protein
VGRKYASVIQAWQKQAVFSQETEWVGPMIAIDAQRVLELKGQIQALDQTIAALVGCSEMARRIDTIPGFGNTDPRLLELTLPAMLDQDPMHEAQLPACTALGTRRGDRGVAAATGS